MSPSANVAAGHRKATLTRDKVIHSILRWNALYGEPPCTADWNPSLARWRAQEWRIERYYAGDPQTGEPWPALNSAKRLFGGSFDAAVREAGLVPHRPGPRRRAAKAPLAPAVGQREPQAPRDVEDELRAAAERVREAEARSARAEERAHRAVERAEHGRAAMSKRLGAAERRADAAEDALREAEARAAALERALAVAESEAQSARARADAGVSVNGHARAAEHRAIAAVSATAARRAEAVLAGRQAELERDRALARAEAAERALRERGGNGARSLADVSALRAGSGPVGPGPVAVALRRLAAARASGDRVALREALTEVASAAVRWRERL
jgi:hypothetical protein